MNMHASFNPADICAAIQQQPATIAPWSSGHVPLAPYVASEEIAAAVAEVVILHKRRQATIKAKVKLSLQYQSIARSIICIESDYEEDEASDHITKYGKKKRVLSKAASERVDAAIAEAKDDIKTKAPEEWCDMAHHIAWYIKAMNMADEQADIYKKQMVKAAKRLPVYAWVERVKGFGDVSFATIVGECGDIGSYKSVSAVWKRMGLAVINGRRQGMPGKDATKQDWIEEGYNKQRRSVSYVAREHVIGGMGKWRPDFGADVDADESLTHYQRVYAKRARYEAAGFCHFKKKNGEPELDENGDIVRVRMSKTGKESYSAHAAMRAHRYVEKMLLKHLYIEWRRAI